MCLVERKLTNDVEFKSNYYEVQTNYREEGKGEVTILVQSGAKLKMERGKRETEVILKRKNGDNIKTMAVCVPPRTRKWLAPTHEEMLGDNVKYERTK